jgi:hypothetical protein
VGKGEFETRGEEIFNLSFVIDGRIVEFEIALQELAEGAGEGQSGD